MNVRDFGAKGDGKTLDTRAIQAAVDRCAAQGGGRVIFSGGSFLTGTIYLKNNVTLCVDRNAVILGSTDAKDYPHNKLDFRFYGDTWVYQSLIFAHNLRNVGIEGDGTIDGQGGHPNFIKTTLEKPDRYRDRPYLLWFAGCDGVTVRGVRLQNSAMWMQSYLRCDNLRIEGIHVHNHANKNNDMMDIDGCHDVVIRGVVGDVDDDGITFKSTTDRICENVVVSDCILSSHCNALKFGTETTAGFRNVAITNVVIRPSAVRTTIYGAPDGNGGLTLQIVDGGVMENITIGNLVIDGPQVPLYIRLGNRARKHYDGAPEPGPGRMRNIRISGLVLRGSSPIACQVMGIPEAKIEGISISDCRFVCTGGGTRSDLDAAVPELETEYPESSIYGNLPAWGLYVRHVKDIDLSNLTFELQGADARPALWFDDAPGANVSGIYTIGHPSAETLGGPGSKNIKAER